MIYFFLENIILNSDLSSVTHSEWDSSNWPVHHALTHLGINLTLHKVQLSWGQILSAELCFLCNWCSLILNLNETSSLQTLKHPANIAKIPQILGWGRVRCPRGPHPGIAPGPHSGPADPGPPRLITWSHSQSFSKLDRSVN